MKTTHELAVMLERLKTAELTSREKHSLIYYLGYEGYLEAEPVIAQYLTHEDAQLRSVALKVLTFMWALPQYGEYCERMLREDPDEDVRHVVPLCLESLYKSTKPKRILRLLRDVFTDPNENAFVKSAAYKAFISIAGVKVSQRVPNQFDSANDIDWILVRGLTR